MEQKQCRKPLFTKDDLLALKETVDLNYLIESLGFKIERDTSSEIRASCIIHGGDNKSAFRLNKDKRTWVCFTHKCHELHGNDLFGLIQGALNINFVEAVNYLKDMVGDVSSYKADLAKKKFKQDRDQFLNQYGKSSRPVFVSEENLKLYKPLRSGYFIKKGFSEDTLNYFEVAGGFTDAWGVVRDIIPIRNVKGELEAYSLRDIRKNADDDYKYIITEGFCKDSVLYNLNKARIFGPDLPLIVVEGFKTVWKFYEYGIYNVVAVMGSFLTEGGVRLLRAYALKGVALMFDPDKAGESGAKLAEASLNKVNIPCSIIKMSPEEGEDPAELTIEQAYRYLNGYIR